MTMTRGRRERVQEFLSGRDRNVLIAEMDSRSGPCVTIEILVSYTTLLPPTAPLVFGHFPVPSQQRVGGNHEGPPT